MQELDALREQGLIQVVKTDVMDTELANKEKLKEKSSAFSEDMGIGFWKNSRWGHFTWADSVSADLTNQIKQIMFPDFERWEEDSQGRAMRDAMALGTHKRYKRDYFVTRDKDFLRVREVLRKELEIRILTPEELVIAIRGNGSGAFGCGRDERGISRWANFLQAFGRKLTSSLRRLLS